MRPSRVMVSASARARFLAGLAAMNAIGMHEALAACVFNAPSLMFFGPLDGCPQSGVDRNLADVVVVPPNRERPLACLALLVRHAVISFVHVFYLLSWYAANFLPCFGA